MSSILEPMGDAAWRIRLPEGADGRSISSALQSLPGVVDVVVCERWALVTFNPASRPGGVVAAVERALLAKDEPAAVREHVVRVRYDGPDLDELACLASLSPPDVCRLHASGEYVVASIGFLPGFAYLRGLHPALVVPRRASPRPRVPGRSVGVAGPYTGVYPFASPGGWTLIGTAVDFTPFDLRAGAAFALGDRVTFMAVAP